MKKIVGILSAAAVLATSVFAADVSAGTKIGGKLFSFTKNKTLEFFAQGNDSHDYTYPNFVFSITGDRAGAELKITTDGVGESGLAARQTTQTIWFKPIDMLKVTVGSYDSALNKETIDYTESWTYLGGAGFLVSLDVAGISVDLGLNEGSGGTLEWGSWWFEKFDGKDPSIKPFFVKGSYAADFGTIGAYAMFNNSRDGTVTEALSTSIRDVEFGAGYKNAFGPVTAFANVVGVADKHFEAIRAEVFASGNVDAFGFSAFVAPLFCVNGKLLDAGADVIDGVEVLAKVSYALDGITPYVYFKDTNILAKDFQSTINCGATGNLGAMGWNLWVRLDIDTADSNASKVAVSVPFELTVNF